MWYLGVIAGAVLRTLDFISAGAAEFVGYLEKGQLPPAKLTLTTANQSFVLEGNGCLSYPAHNHTRLELPVRLGGCLASEAQSGEQLKSEP